VGISGSTLVELTWIVIPTILALGVYVWASRLYFDMLRVPADPNALEISVVAKQWMWKFQHPEGQREVNTLHVPVGRRVKLQMISQDVIHSFYVPAFRVKQDVLPGRYTAAWFEATKPGQYHLFCAEYCGTQHSGMTGTVFVMEPANFERWLADAAARARAPAQGPSAGPQTMAGAGEQLFQRFGCISCHRPDGSGRCPSLVGVFGTQVQLESGQTVTADATYVRESILRPTAKVVAGYEPVMPSFEGQVTEEQIMQLIAYIRSLGSETRGEGN
jgi:cytochrome c oxidase subunit 2